MIQPASKTGARACSGISLGALLWRASFLPSALRPLRPRQQWRLPSLSYASDDEVASLARTGFIISPDWSLSDEVNLGGTGGALLEDPDGWAIGGKLGYDQQFGHIVVGVITDAFYSFADGGGRGAGFGRFESDLNYYGTVRGRLGYSFGRLMAYGTAGYAYGGLEVKDVTTGAKSE